MRRRLAAVAVLVAALVVASTAATVPASSKQPVVATKHVPKHVVKKAVTKKAVTKKAVKKKVVVKKVVVKKVVAKPQTTAAPATPAQTTEVTVSMFEMGFKLSTTVVPHGTVIFKVVNDGVVPHDFRIGSQATEILDSGQSETLTVTLSKPGQFTFLCTVSGHAGAGMIGALTVK